MAFVTNVCSGAGTSIGTRLKFSLFFAPERPYKLEKKAGYEGSAEDKTIWSVKTWGLTSSQTAIAEVSK